MISKKSPGPRLAQVVGLALLLAFLWASPASAKKAKPGEGVSPRESQAGIAAAPRAQGLAAFFSSMASNTMVTRSVSMPDVGLKLPVVMGGGQTQRDIYWPVPANLVLSDAQIHLDASYKRAEEGRTTLILSIDNAPVTARKFSTDSGDASVVVPVPGIAQPSGFVRFGVTWNTVIPLSALDSICSDMRSLANLLRIEPTSRLVYRFDAGQIRDLSTAWTALAQRPLIMVSANQLAPDAFETAWRTGLALERAGKQPSIVALPAAGQEVDTGKLLVPDALLKISAFAALSQGGKRILKNPAEAAALFVLHQISDTPADVLVADQAFVTRLSLGMDALTQQVRDEAPDALANFMTWRSRRMDALLKAPEAGQIVLAQAPGGAAIVLAPGAGIRLAEIFDSSWRGVAASTALSVKTASPAPTDANMVSLAALGAAPGSFDVIGYGEWVAKFDIGAGALRGRRPTELVMDLSAAPSSGGTVPVASVFLNEILIASSVMAANGQRERLTAALPSYSLGARNVIRVSFVRQLLSDRCRENPGAFPAAVLASSHLVLGGENADDDFRGMSARLSQGGEVHVPKSHLNDARASLGRLIRLSAATDVSTTRSKLVVVDDGARAAPKAPFLAIDVNLPEGKRKLAVSKGQLVLTNEANHKLLDVAGLTGIAAASVERVGSHPGIFYQTVAGDMRTFDKAFQLMNGDFALIGAGGLIGEYDHRTSLDRRLFDEVKVPWFKVYAWWIIPLLCIFGFVGLLYAASRYRNRNRSGS